MASAYLKLVDRSWPLLRRLMDGHAAIYKASGGWVGHRLPFLPGIALVDHVGAKSGKKRTTALLYVEDGDDVVVIASKGGFPKHPAWYHNLRANPDTSIQIGRERRAVHARDATPEERARIWPKAVETYKPYADYQARTPREIPVVILERRA